MHLALNINKLMTCQKVKVKDVALLLLYLILYYTTTTTTTTNIYHISNNTHKLTAYRLYNAGQALGTG
jgi:hypothetical protein